MARSAWVLGVAVGAIAVLGGAGCAGETFSSTNTGGSGGSQATTGGTGGVGGSTVTTGGTGGVGGSTTATGGTGTGTGGSGGAPECQPLSDACAQCAFAACQDLYCVCYAEIDCAALVSCASTCEAGDIACQQPCLTEHEQSISKAFLLGGCAAESCAADCMGVTPVGGCEQCMFTACEPQMNTCLADAECNQIVQCAIQCPGGDFQCPLACTNGKSQPAINKALAAQSCMNSNCGNMCP